MAALLVFRRNNLRRERVFRDRSNPLEIHNDRELIARYRLPRGVILQLVDDLSGRLKHDTARSQAIPVVIQVCVALRLLAKGSFLSEVADVHGISKASAGVCLSAVIGAICDSDVGNIHFPDTPEEEALVKREFYKIAEFPNVIGVVDGTQIPIIAPTIDEPSFVCRKGYHSLNVQAIVKADLRFINIVSQWPGSVHDAYIWASCSVARKLENGDVNGWILGDSGYPLRPWLLTPKADPQNRGEQAYNRSFKCTRSIVERAFGILKSRFRCLHKSGGCLHFAPAKCCKIILAAAKLHNLCIEQNVPTPDLLPDEDEDQVTYHGPLNDGKAVQNRLIATRFS